MPLSQAFQGLATQNFSLTNLSFFKKSHNAALLFPDGTCLFGFGIGKEGITFGEICFNTAISGYQEILTDPSYLGQIITFTFPHIGNVGANQNDIEANKVRASGLIVREPITKPSNYRSNQDFCSWLVSNNLTGICGIDTRFITQKVRASGASSVAIIFSENLSDELLQKTLEELQNKPDLKGAELASKASQNQQFVWPNEGRWSQEENSYLKPKSCGLKIVAIDFGAKLNILRCLTDLGCEVQVVGAKASFEEIMSFNPDGIFLSNGPGDPAATGVYAIPVIQKILAQKIPLFGICLGHQLLALALGAKTSKMHQGHRGANHPVQNLKTKKVEITSQNHGFCVEADSLPSNVEITHLSLFDSSVEGIRLKDGSAFAVQYHPESSPGPSDSFYLFEEFIEMIKSSKKN